MPIYRSPHHDPTIIYTLLSGLITDQELLAYYSDALTSWPGGRWRELVDGTQITDMALTPTSLKQLAHLVTSHIQRLNNARVAMVAQSDLAYGMFRMWELQRAQLGYDVRVFRQLGEAERWLLRGEKTC